MEGGLIIQDCANEYSRLSGFVVFNVEAAVTESLEEALLEKVERTVEISSTSVVCIMLSKVVGDDEVDDCFMVEFCRSTPATVVEFVGVAMKIV